MGGRLFYTYIMASRTRVIYVGVTNDLWRRVLEHRRGEGSGFAARYQCGRLVWFEAHAGGARAIAREKELKGWIWLRKIVLIEEGNKGWEDLGVGLFGVD